MPRKVSSSAITDTLCPETHPPRSPLWTFKGPSSSRTFTKSTRAKFVLRRLSGGAKSRQLLLRSLDPAHFHNRYPRVLRQRHKAYGRAFETLALWVLFVLSSNLIIHDAVLRLLHFMTTGCILCESFNCFFRSCEQLAHGNKETSWPYSARFLRIE